jgi:hypothetical protein
VKRLKRGWRAATDRNVTKSDLLADLDVQALSHVDATDTISSLHLFYWAGKLSGVYTEQGAIEM